MAHEIAHARHAHIPWLAVVFVSAFGCIGALAGGVWQGVLDLAGISIDPETIARSARAAAAEAPDTFSTLIIIVGDSIVTSGSLVGGVLVLGFASRRFEWQADAFAAKSLSELPALPAPDTRLTHPFTHSESGEGGTVPSATAAGVSTEIDLRPGQSAEAGIGGRSDQLTLFPELPPEAYGRSEGVAPVAPVAPVGPLAVSTISGEGSAPAPAPTFRAPIEASEPANDEPPGMVRRAAVDAMAEALQTVAALNYIPRHRASFRHGSIAQRQRKLRELVGLPLDRLPIDRSVRWIKRAAALGLCTLIVLFVLGL